jgi:predicted ATP-dependent protease
MLIDNSEAEGAPVIIADNPTYYNLIGKVEYETRMGMLSTDFNKIKPDYLHQANGGYLIVQVKDILFNSFAWEALKRDLKRNRIRIENINEQFNGQSGTSLKPETIPLNVKVIIIDGSDIYNILYSYDENFRELLKIRADFDTEMNNNEENL